MTVAPQYTQNLKKELFSKERYVVKLAGIWDLWEKPEQEYLVHWKFMTKHFGVDTLCMTPVSGIAEKKSNSDMTECKLTEMPTLEDVIQANPECTPVIIDENGKIELEHFAHPDKALYVFGRVSISPLETLKGEYASVRIPSWAKDTNTSRGLLHPHQAASIVLYDRMIKL